MEKAGHWSEFLEVYHLRLFCLCFLSTVSEHLTLYPLMPKILPKYMRPWTEPYGSLSPLSCIMYLCHSSRGSWHSRPQAIVCSGPSLVLSQGVRGQKAWRPEWSVLLCAVGSMQNCCCSPLKMTSWEFSWGSALKWDRLGPRDRSRKPRSSFHGMALPRMQYRKAGRYCCPGYPQGGFTECGPGPRWVFAVLACLICQHFGQQPKQLHHCVKSSLVPSLPWLGSNLAGKTHSQLSQSQNGKATISSAKTKDESREPGTSLVNLCSFGLLKSSLGTTRVFHSDYGNSLC